MDLHTLTFQEILDRISRHCPEAFSTYIHCFNRCDDDGLVIFTREYIDVDMSEDFRVFRNNIKKLARENLLTWSPIENGLEIMLIYEGEDDE